MHKEGECTSVTERYGIQVKVPKQMLEELLQNDGVIDGDEGQGQRQEGQHQNCLQGIRVISKNGGTGVSSGGCFARRRVNAMFMAESFASRDAEEVAIEASRLITAAREAAAERDDWAGLTDCGSARAKVVEHDKSIVWEDRSNSEGNTDRKYAWGLSVRGHV